LGFSVPLISVFSLVLLFVVYSFIAGETVIPFNLRIILDSLAGLYLQRQFIGTLTLRAVTKASW